MVMAAFFKRVDMPEPASGPFKFTPAGKISLDVQGTRKEPGASAFQSNSSSTSFAVGRCASPGSIARPTTESRSPDYSIGAIVLDRATSVPLQSTSACSNSEHEPRNSSLNSTSASDECTSNAITEDSRQTTAITSAVDVCGSDNSPLTAEIDLPKMGVSLSQLADALHNPVSSDSFLAPQKPNKVKKPKSKQQSRPKSAGKEPKSAPVDVDAVIRFASAKCDELNVVETKLRNAEALVVANEIQAQTLERQCRNLETNFKAERKANEELRGQIEQTQLIPTVNDSECYGLTVHAKQNTGENRALTTQVDKIEKHLASLMPDVQHLKNYCTSNEVDKQAKHLASEKMEYILAIHVTLQNKLEEGFAAFSVSADVTTQIETLRFQVSLLTDRNKDLLSKLSETVGVLSEERDQRCRLERQLENSTNNYSTLNDKIAQCTSFIHDLQERISCPDEIVSIERQKSYEDISESLKRLHNSVASKPLQRGQALTKKSIRISSLRLGRQMRMSETCRLSADAKLETAMSEKFETLQNMLSSLAPASQELLTLRTSNEIFEQRLSCQEQTMLELQCQRDAAEKRLKGSNVEVFELRNMLSPSLRRAERAFHTAESAMKDRIKSLHQHNQALILATAMADAFKSRNEYFVAQLRHSDSQTTTLQKEVQAMKSKLLIAESEKHSVEKELSFATQLRTLASENNSTIHPEESRAPQTKLRRESPQFDFHSLKPKNNLKKANRQGMEIATILPTNNANADAAIGQGDGVEILPRALNKATHAPIQIDLDDEMLDSLEPQTNVRHFSELSLPSAPKNRTRVKRTISSLGPSRQHRHVNNSAEDTGSGPGHIEEVPQKDSASTKRVKLTFEEAMPAGTKRRNSPRQGRSSKSSRTFGSVQSPHKYDTRHKPKT